MVQHVWPRVTLITVRNFSIRNPLLQLAHEQSVLQFNGWSERSRLDVCRYRNPVVCRFSVNYILGVTSPLAVTTPNACGGSAPRARLRMCCLLNSSSTSSSFAPSSDNWHKMRNGPRRRGHFRAWSYRMRIADVDIVVRYGHILHSTDELTVLVRVPAKDRRDRRRGGGEAAVIWERQFGQLQFTGLQERHCSSKGWSLLTASRKQRQQLTCCCNLQSSSKFDCLNLFLHTLSIVSGDPLGFVALPLSANE